MATILSDENLASYKAQMENFDIQVKAWSTYLNDAEKALTNSTGATFRLKYAKGLKATANIKIIIDILQSVQKDLKVLSETSNAYYTTCLNASNS